MNLKDYKQVSVIYTTTDDSIFYVDNPNGSMFRTSDVIDTIVEQYSKKRIIILEGEDPLPNDIGFKEIIDKYKKTTTFFMREYADEYEDADVHPITFGFPKEKICFDSVIKNHLMCPIIPGNYDSYITDNELLYYKTIQQSQFTVSGGAQGYDCMRHYDIIFNKSYIKYII